MARERSDHEVNDLMQGWSVKVIKNDGVEATYPVTPRVIVAFERTHKIGIGKALADGQKMSDLYWLGWESERAAGNIVPLFDAWLDDVFAVEMGDDDVPLVETPTVIL